MVQSSPPPSERGSVCTSRRRSRLCEAHERLHDGSSAGANRETVTRTWIAGTKGGEATRPADWRQRTDRGRIAGTHLRFWNILIIVCAHIEYNDQSVSCCVVPFAGCRKHIVSLSSEIHLLKENEWICKGIIRLNDASFSYLFIHCCCCIYIFDYIWIAKTQNWYINYKNDVTDTERDMIRKESERELWDTIDLQGKREI